ncbi:MAG: hypothetical protein J6P13_05560, partial [Kiritimatiellae bacterium]|nr:hypothetical protein [Kiritimatiellia bacterium]
GIGCGDQGGGGSIRIENGTVVSIGGGNASPELGGAAIGHVKSVMFTGGAIYVADKGLRPAPTNDFSSAVYPVDFNIGTPVAKVDSVAIFLDGTECAYGTEGLYTDESGKLRLWLPNGDYEFSVNGNDYTATIADAGVEARRKSAVPDSIRIESIALSEEKATLVVSAEPDDWITDISAQLLRVRAAEALPLPEGDAALLPQAEVGVSTNGDGTATLTIPRAADAPQKFYRVEVQ